MRGLHLDTLRPRDLWARELPAAVVPCNTLLVNGKAAVPSHLVEDWHARQAPLRSGERHRGRKGRAAQGKKRAENLTDQNLTELRSTDRNSW